MEVNCVVLGARPVDSGYAAVDLPQQLLLLSRPRTFIGPKRCQEFQRDWLSELGIRVVFDDALDAPLGGMEVADG